MFPIEIFRATLEKLTRILAEHEIRFHLTGGITGAAYGEPRMTQDVDVVIDPQASAVNVELLVRSLAGSDFLYHEQSVRKAISNGGMFQLLDRKESLKLDVYPRELIPGELDRSEIAEVFEGKLLPIVSRSDAAASKLVWVAKGSHKSRRDLRQIYRNADAEARIRIEQLAEQLALQTLLHEVLGEPDELE